MARRTDGRLEIRGLRQPDPIVPTPIGRDIYHRPARPAVDNSKAQALIGALGIAKGLIGPLMKGMKEQELANKKAYADDMWRQWNVYLSSTEQPEVLASIREGRNRFAADPIIGAAVRKYHGGLEGRALANEIAQDPEFLEGVGTTGFNVENYILRKAEPYVDRLGESRESITTFRRSLDSLRGKITKQHQEALGVKQQRYLETMAADYLNQALDSGAEKGLNGVQLMEQIRKGVYPDLGPRIEGGSLDLKKARLDEILLDTFQARADDPKHAQTILEALHAPRTDSRTGQPLGSLAQVHRHRNQVATIRRKAVNALVGDAQDAMKKQMQSINLARVYAGDGAYFQDVEIDLKEGLPKGHILRSIPDLDAKFKYTARQQEEDAFRAAALQERQAAGINAPTFREISLYVKNGKKHPGIVGKLTGAVRGAMTMDLTKATPEERGEKLEAIMSGYELYKSAKTVSPTTANWLPKDVREFYENFENALTYRQSSPKEAADVALRIAMSGDDGSVSKSAIDAKINTLGTNVVGNSWWGGKVSNMNEVRTAVKRAAELYVRSGGLDVETAVKKAIEDINETSVVVNGRSLINDPHMTKTMVPHAEKIIEKFYDRFKDDLKSYGIDEASDISIVPVGEGGNYQFIDKTNGMVLLVPGVPDPSVLAVMTPEEQEELLSDGLIAGPRGFDFKDLKIMEAESLKGANTTIGEAVSRRTERLTRQETIRKDLERKREERKERETQQKGVGFEDSIGGVITKKFKDALDLDD